MVSSVTSPSIKLTPLTTKMTLIASDLVISVTSVLDSTGWQLNLWAALQAAQTLKDHNSNPVQ